MNDLEYEDHGFHPRSGNDGLSLECLGDCELTYVCVPETGPAYAWFRVRSLRPAQKDDSTSKEQP